MEQQLLEQFKILYEKQDMLSRLTDQSLYSSLGYSEIHCLAAIGSLGTPNATAIAKQLHITRGAISKILKKLMQRELIESFSRQDNKKEKYYKLTTQGQMADQQHAKAHHEWEQRDIKFLQTVPQTEREIVMDFLAQFNSYLDQLIKERTK